MLTLQIVIKVIDRRYCAFLNTFASPAAGRPLEVNSRQFEPQICFFFVAPCDFASENAIFFFRRPLRGLLSSIQSSLQDMPPKADQLAARRELINLWVPAQLTDLGHPQNN